MTGHSWKLDPMGNPESADDSEYVNMIGAVTHATNHFFNVNGIPNNVRRSVLISLYVNMTEGCSNKEKEMAILDFQVIIENLRSTLRKDSLEHVCMFRFASTTYPESPNDSVYSLIGEIQGKTYNAIAPKAASRDLKAQLRLLNPLMKELVEKATAGLS